MNSLQVHYISRLLNQRPKPNGSESWNWLAKTHSGEMLSLYYEEGKDGHGDFVEVYDPKNILGLNNLKFDDVVNIRILDIPKHFKVTR